MSAEAGATGALWEGFPENRAPTHLVLMGCIVGENAPNGMPVGDLFAIDPDADMPTYTLLDDAGGRFKIVGGSLVVTDGSLIDFEAAQYHDVKVRATDPHGEFIEQIFRIFVVDQREPGEPDENHAPVDLRLYGSVVAEHATDGTYIGSVMGFDFDDGDRLTYKLLDDADGRFALVNGNIVVKDGSRLDYENATSYDIRVRVTDSRGAVLEKTFTISLKDMPETPPPVNRAPTDLSLIGNTVFENAANGTVIGEVGASDPDAGDTLTFTLVEDHNGAFALVDGKIVVADGTQLDYETDQVYSVTIRVADQHGAALEKTFRIFLKDMPDTGNQAPNVLVLQSNVVFENAANGTAIGELVGYDPDPNSILTYKLVDDAGGRFAIENGAIVVKDGSLLDYEAAAFHEIRVRLTDEHGAFLEKTFTIILKDLPDTPPPVNHAPTELDLTMNSIWENAPNGSDVGYLRASDPDGGDRFTYTLLDDADGRFAIYGSSLVVKDGKRLDYEAASSHQVKVRVTDSHGATLDKVFTINLLNVIEPNEKPPENSAPSHLDLSWNYVAENAENGSQIGSFLGFDPDGDELTYSLLNDAGGRFAIEDGKLVVKDGSLLDYEAKAFHDIKVRVTDTHGESYDRTFTILLKNIAEAGDPLPPGNHAPTDIFLARTELHENPRDGVLVSALFAVDPDPYERFTYKLLDDADGRFAINGAKLLVADGSRIDYEANSSHTIRIQVTDSRGASFEKDIVIQIKDVVEANLVLTGGAKNDRLSGAGGNDKLSGGAGNDVLAGGTGNDILTGSRGKDSFVFDAAGKTNVDRIKDFSVKDDTIHLDRSVFTEIGGKGKLAAGAFWIGAKAHDANDRIVYNSKTGIVSYDADGSGGAAAVQIATLQKGLANLSHKDFLVI